MKPFNLEHAIKSRRAKTAYGTILQLTAVRVGPGILEWVHGQQRALTDYNGKVDDKEYLYSAEIDRTTQVFYAVKTPLMKNYAMVHGKDDYPKYTMRYEITLNIEDGEIKSAEVVKNG